MFFDMRSIYSLYSNGGLQEVRRGIRDYYAYHLSPRSLYETIAGKIGSLLPSDSIRERDRGVLVVLDGCRLDTFRNVELW